MVLRLIKVNVSQNYCEYKKFAQGDKTAESSLRQQLDIAGNLPAKLIDRGELMFVSDFSFQAEL